MIFAAVKNMKVHSGVFQKQIIQTQVWKLNNVNNYNQSTI